jgi:S-methylmethionine-dependent homocysteine/selenocysteine methylase
MNASYDTIQARLDAGEVIVLDGGTGTEMQRLGAPMSREVWCALATRTHPQVVRRVHAAFIEAGADIVTANTYASSPLIMARHGYLDETEELDKAAVEIARDAASQADRPVCVAGSMSVMRPIIPGTDRIDPDWSLPERESRDLFRRKAEALAATGVDLIIMEMMRDGDYSLWASEAARDTGLPVWIGLSCRTRESDGALVGYNREDCPLEDVIALLAGTGPRAMAIMHSSINDTDAALPLLHSLWGGPYGAYPESGHFTIPDWVFGEIAPGAFAEHALGWVRAGAQIVGGCCGVTPEHIAALSRVLRDEHAHEKGIA